MGTQFAFLALDFGIVLRTLPKQESLRCGFQTSGGSHMGARTS
jgi:hypothetical protein